MRRYLTPVVAVITALSLPARNPAYAQDLTRCLGQREYSQVCERVQSGDQCSPPLTTLCCECETIWGQEFPYCEHQEELYPPITPELPPTPVPTVAPVPRPTPVATPTPTTLRPSTCSGAVLMVVGNTSSHAGDAELKNRLIALGFEVTTREDKDFTTQEANKSGMVVLSSSASSSVVAKADLESLTAPLLTWEPYNHDDLALSTTSPKYDKEIKEVTIKNNSHEITQGFNGNVAVFTKPSFLGFAVPPTSGTMLASSTGTKEGGALVVFEPGAALGSGRKASARIATFFTRNYEAGTLTHEGVTLFDRAAAWVASCDAGDTPPPAPVCAKRGLFLAGNKDLHAADRELARQIESHGIELTNVDDDTFTLDNLKDIDVLFISSSVNSSRIAYLPLAEIKIPVLIWEAWSFDDFALSTKDYGKAEDTGTLDLSDLPHPLIEGFPPTLNVYKNKQDGSLPYATISDEATVLATIEDSPEKASVFLYEKGAKLTSGTPAPARRASFFARNYKQGNLTDEGKALFDRLIAWVTPVCQ